jgi:uncharacterized membrane protein
VGFRRAALTLPAERNKDQIMTNHKTRLAVAVVALGLLTAACGERPVDRALTGGAIGAASGAVVGSTVGAPVTGAVVGGAGGAAIGAVTAPKR